MYPLSHHSLILPVLKTHAKHHAQYSSIKEFLTLSRKVKELWVFGPLGKEDHERKTKDDQIERDVAQVSDLLNQIEALNMQKLAEGTGGSWSPLTKNEPEPGVGGAAQSAVVGGTAAK